MRHREGMEAGLVFEETASSGASPPDYAPVLEYIAGYWEGLIRFHPHDSGTLIGLPRPYLVPSSDPNRPLFQEMYYWDSYFMAIGLVGTPYEWLIIDMTENMAALIERFGFIPNGNRYYLTSRSQPPFFTRMVRLAYDIKTARGDGDCADFLKRMITLAVREHETCWTAEKHPHERAVYRGLSRYHDINYSHFLASCESGWDHSTRCDGDRPGTESGRWMDFLPVCLNSILFVREEDFAWAFDQLGDTSASMYWQALAVDRAAVMTELFWDEGKGFFFDYEWKTRTPGNQPSLAGFYPLWAAFASAEQARQIVAEWLPRFLFPGGLVTTLTSFPERQWAFPNGWAPLQWLVAQGLDRYGFLAEANDIRRRWCDTCARLFSVRGRLFEKYHVGSGLGDAECGPYGMVEGFGWTNAVFVDFVKRLSTST